MNDNVNLKNTLDKFGKYVIQQSKSNLTKNDKKDTSDLYNSMSYESKVSARGNFEFTFFMEDYGAFVDKGVKGKNSIKKAPNSPFRFGSGKSSSSGSGLTDAINGWVKRKRIQFRKLNGRFMTFEQTAYRISGSIWKTGLKTTDFFTTPFERAFDKLPDELLIAFGLDSDKFLESSTKNNRI